MIVGIVLFLFLYDQVGRISMVGQPIAYGPLTQAIQKRSTEYFYGYVVVALQNEDIIANILSNIANSTFDVAQRQIRIGKEVLYIWRFDNQKDLQSAMSQISKDGCSVVPCKSRIKLGYKDSAGYFFFNKNSLFHYLGGDERALAVLANEFGDSFAGDDFR